MGTLTNFRWLPVAAWALVLLSYGQDAAKPQPARAEPAKVPATKPENPPVEGSKPESGMKPEPAEPAKAEAGAKPSPPKVPPKPEPVKYTELKKSIWPPKGGVKTPGVQIPI